MIPSIGQMIPARNISSWDYEGEMIVGYYDYFGYDMYGFSNQLSMGSMSPSSPQVTDFNVVDQIYFISGMDTLAVQDSSGKKACNTIEIDGVEFTGFDSDGFLTIISNPFPGTGQTCTIKLK